MENKMLEMGSLIAQVRTLEHQVEDLQLDMKELLGLANRSKGGLWAGMAIASTLGSMATLIIEALFRR